MLLQHSRRRARTDERGDIVLLEEQDRARWDRSEIERALPMVEAAMRGMGPRPYALQAAIAALHAQAASPEQTDWLQIAALYELMQHVAPSPVVQLNRAVAIAMSGQLERGLAEVERLEQSGALARYHLLAATKADLMRRLGRREDAARAYRAALALTENDVERRFLARRLTELD